MRSTQHREGVVTHADLVSRVMSELRQLWRFKLLQQSQKINSISIQYIWTQNKIFVTGSPTGPTEEETSYDYEEEEEAPGETRWDSIIFSSAFYSGLISLVEIFSCAQIKNPKEKLSLQKTSSPQRRKSSRGTGGAAEPQVCDGGAECPCQRGRQHKVLVKITILVIIVNEGDNIRSLSTLQQYLTQTLSSNHQNYSFQRGGQHQVFVGIITNIIIKITKPPKLFLSSWL